MTKRWWSIATGIVTLAAAARLLLPTVADPDLWGHVLFGRRTLAHGLERTDPFSYLSGDGPWINHEWLSEVAFGIVYDLGGGQGLILMKGLVGLAIVALVYRHLVVRGSDPLRAGLLMLPSLLLLVPGLSTVRPQMFTYLLFALTLLLLHRVESGRPALLWAAPLVLAVWVNLHGGVLAGVGVLGVWGVARTAGELAKHPPREAWRRLRRPVVAGLLCALALLANPYGAGLPAFLLRTGTGSRPDIIEWQTLHIASVPGGVYLALLGIALWSVLRAPGRTPPPLLAVLAVVALLPLTAVRHLQLFAIAVPLLIADAFGQAWRREGPMRNAGPAERWLVGGVTGVAAAALLGSAVVEARCIRIDPDRSTAFPARAVAWLDASGVRANAATYFDWGEYIIWHLAPRVQVSMDGRRETVYPDSIYREYLRFQNGVGDWRGLLDRPETEMVVFPRGWPGTNLTDLSPAWDRIYEDPLATVFVRAGHPETARLARTPIPELPADGAGRCAP